MPWDATHSTSQFQAFLRSFKQTSVIGAPRSRGSDRPDAPDAGDDVIEGIKTSVPLHLQILNDPDFIAGRLGTGFMDGYMPVAKPNKVAESA